MGYLSEWINVKSPVCPYCGSSNWVTADEDKEGIEDAWEEFDEEEWVEDEYGERHDVLCKCEDCGFPFVVKDIWDLDSHRLITGQFMDVEVFELPVKTQSFWNTEVAANGSSFWSRNKKKGRKSLWSRIQEKFSM